MEDANRLHLFWTIGPAPPPPPPPVGICNRRPRMKHTFHRQSSEFVQLAFVVLFLSSFFSFHFNFLSFCLALFKIFCNIFRFVEWRVSSAIRHVRPSSHLDAMDAFNRRQNDHFFLFQRRENFKENLFDYYFFFRKLKIRIIY